MLDDTTSTNDVISASSDAAENASDVTESSPSAHKGPSDVIVVFFGFVIVSGIVGCVANGLVLKILLAPKLRSQISNLLMINQIATDLYSCVLLVVCYSYRLRKIPLRGYLGQVVCAVVRNDLLIFVGLAGSIASVGTITAERYFKVVHSLAHRKNFRNWMVYAAIGLTWINGLLTNIAGIWTSVVVDETCFAYARWPSGHAATAYAVFILVWEYFVPMLMFVYCYGHILLVIRAQAKVFHGANVNQHQQHDGTETTTTAAASAAVNRAQLSVIATMIGICVAFAVCWTPNQIWFILSTIGYQAPLDVYYATLFMIYLNTALNPFIYAFKHDAVRRGLHRMLCRKEEPSNRYPTSNTTTTTTT